ncbi:hypothetical protein BB558_002194 [Smittium angustum]|uniref:Uncharacterized protein n=1 Tax=Smittium angustum TaxID=133377 RepID=A0A2U1J9D7_SMIAN|nr:hypothetical protein BB558_002194 [Smittium angustum]
MEKISSYEILSQIFVLAQNPNVRLLSRNFYEISSIDSIRADFFIQKYGKKNVFRALNTSFSSYTGFFKNQDFVIQLLKKGADLDSITKQKLFGNSIRKRWDKVVEYLISLFHETTEKKFNIAVEKRYAETGIEISMPQQKAMKYFVPTIDINSNTGRTFRIAVSSGKVETVKLLINAHQIKPKLDCDESEIEVLSHPKVIMEDINLKHLCDMFQTEGISLLKLFYINKFHEFSVDGYIFSEFCKRGDFEFVKFLVENGIDINENDGSPIEYASEYKNFELEEYLQARGARGRTNASLDYLFPSQSKNTDTFDQQEKKKVKIDSDSSDIFGNQITSKINTDYTLYNISPDIYLDKIRNGSDIHVNNEFALKDASENGYLNAVEYLVENGADIHVDQDWALGMASKSGHFNVVKYLVSKGANIQARENFALGIACRNGHFDIVKFFIENGADFAAENHWKTIFKEKNKHLDVINYLTERGLDYYIKRITILEYASSIGRLDIIKYLVEKGADIGADNRFALTFACEKGHFDIVKYLLDIGPDIHSYDDLSLRLALVNKHYHIVRYLEDKKQT